MKVFTKKISATILSLVVLFSSMSFTIDTHYCGGNLVDISYFGEADNCGVEEMQMDSDVTKIKKNKCCKDEITIVESSTFNKEELITIQINDIEFVFAFAYSYINSNQNILLENEYYKDFSPPGIDQDILVLHQSFLI